MCECQYEGGRYERVTDNLFRDHAKTDCPFVVRWKEGKLKREKPLPLGTTEKEARKERDLVMVSDITERPSHGRMTIAQLWDLFQAERLLDAKLPVEDEARLTEGTSRKYRRDWSLHVQPFLRSNMKLKDVRPEHVERLLEQMKQPREGFNDGKPYAPNTRTSVYVLLSSVFSFAVERKLLVASPVARIEKAKRPTGPATKKVGRGKVIKREELQRLFASFSGDLWVAVARLRLHTGLRPSEALGLTWEQIDWESGTLCVDRQLKVHHTSAIQATWFGPPKGKRLFVPGEGRLVDLSPIVLALLKEQQRRNRERGLTFCPLVFPTAVGTPTRQSNYREAFVDALAKAGIERPLTPHALRHTFASALFSAGTPLETVSHLLGHASISTTEDIYIDFIDRDARRAQLLEQMAASSIAGL